jgi:hypothetical protein
MNVPKSGKKLCLQNKDKPYWIQAMEEGKTMKRKTG